MNVSLSRVGLTGLFGMADIGGAGVWGGLVSSGAYVTGDTGVDFGNTIYNDHHFHYGYHVLAAAAIGHLDPSWIPENKEYVDLLIRDFANPSDKDGFFPQWRSFDWYHGHSWAHGLHPSFDGKVSAWKQCSSVRLVF